MPTYQHSDNSTTHQIQNLQTGKTMSFNIKLLLYRKCRSKFILIPQPTPCSKCLSEAQWISFTLIINLLILTPTNTVTHKEKEELWHIILLRLIQAKVIMNDDYILTELQQYFPMLSLSCVVYFAMLSAPGLHSADVWIWIWFLV